MIKLQEDAVCFITLIFLYLIKKHNLFWGEGGALDLMS